MRKVKVNKRKIYLREAEERKKERKKEREKERKVYSKIKLGKSN